MQIICYTSSITKAVNIQNSTSKVINIISFPTSFKSPVLSQGMLEMFAIQHTSSLQNFVLIGRRIQKE